MLTGPRACGKTTTARRRATSTLQLDTPRDALLMREEPDQQLRGLVPPILIDEWQDVPESLSAVKRAVDEDSQPGRFLITGSVRARTLTGTWPGTGRITPIQMHPLTQDELANKGKNLDFIDRLFQQDISDTIPSEAPALRDYVELAAAGGFPQAQKGSPRFRDQWFEGYISQAVGRDVEPLGEVREPLAMERLLRAAALNTAGIPTHETLVRAASTSRETTDRYLDLLEELGLLERIPAWGHNRLKRMIKSPKLHVTDTGLALWLAGVSADAVLDDSNLLGRIIESYVGMQLRPMLSAGPRRGRMTHLRDTNGRREVDFIIEDRRGDVVVAEVKASANIDRRMGRHMEWLRDEIGEPFKAGVLFHTGRTIHEVSDRIWAMPISAMWS
nr:DUF4143 domain-containing protein [Nesterenkonia populi]